VRAGAVAVNDHAFHWGEPTAEWSGAGTYSGFGHTHGVLGLMEVVRPKLISLDMRHGGQEPWWYPYDEKTNHLLRNTARMLYGPAVRRPWAMFSMLLNPRTWQRVNLARFVMAIRKWL
jgi:hypothetical protein